MAPFHSPTQDPTLALHRDLELIEHLDALGFEEAWIGEHHSGGWEIIADPMVFIAAAAARTRSIRLGTGVSSLPYHHPLILADRMVLLDHLTRGRVMLGVGPGQLTSDARMLGIEPNDQRRMMEESLEVITALLRGETVNRTTDWFTIADGVLQLRPYSHPCFELCVAATFSPAGPRSAARHGTGLLSVAATQESGFDALGTHWGIIEEESTVHGTTPDRRAWRLMGPMHVAETEDEAIAEVAYGYDRVFDYLRHVVPVPPADEGSLEERVKAANLTGSVCFGTPEMARAQIQRLLDQSGGFGAYLFMGGDFADPAATRRSYELFAREVAPHFRHQLAPVAAADARVRNRDGAGEVLTAAIQAGVEYEAEKAART
ncbi:MAG: LLM class flavin-dependent oxidoreductase [Acidimicrobiia bacterium]|nr:LLM class flavin-dependent oxidoreductase [Acidimicrobiia bacterium]